MDEYPDVFEGIGKAKTVYCAKLKKDAHPVIKPCRLVRHALLRPLKNKLDPMVEKGVDKSNNKAHSMGQSVVRRVQTEQEITGLLRSHQIEQSFIA